jgi:transposase-like protein
VPNNYPPEFRRQMVELVRAGRTPEELAKEFQPSAQSIRTWVRQADLDDGRRLPTTMTPPRWLAKVAISTARLSFPSSPADLQLIVQVLGLARGLVVHKSSDERVRDHFRGCAEQGGKTGERKIMRAPVYQAVAE